MNIFISYNKNDKDVVNKFEEILKNKKDDQISWSVWRDVIF